MQAEQLKEEEKSLRTLIHSFGTTSSWADLAARERGGTLCASGLIRCVLLSLRSYLIRGAMVTLVHPFLSIRESTYGEIFQLRVPTSS